MKKQVSAHRFPKVYESLGIDLGSLGCVMLDVEVPKLGITIPEEHLYRSPDPRKFWIDGYVFEKNPHLTLLYGLMQPAEHWKHEIREVLSDWEMPETLKIADIGFFNTPYPEEPYYCIIAHVEVSPELLEGHERLQMLPHVDTYCGYRPHITLAYVKHDEVIRNNVMRYFRGALFRKSVKVKPELNLGGNH